MTDAEIVPQPPAELQILDSKSRALYERIAEIKITDENSYKLMAEVLWQVKSLSSVILERFEPHIKRAHEAHKGLCEEKKKSLDGLLDAERLAKEKIAHYVEHSGTVPEVKGLAVIDDWTGEVVDSSKLPKKYLIPDTDKLVEHTKLYKEATNIPGWRVIKRKKVAQRTK